MHDCRTRTDPAAAAHILAAHCVSGESQEVLLFPAMKPVEGGAKVTDTAAQVKSDQVAAGTEDERPH